MKRGVWVIAGILLGNPESGRATEMTTRMLDAQRIHFRDVVPEATGSLALLDLGAAPPPGGSRLFSRDDLRTAALLAHEEEKGLRLPASVRVIRVTRRFSERELDMLIRPSLVALLPSGTTILSVHLPKSVTTAPNVAVGSIHFPRLPKRAGLAHTTAVAELVAAGDVLLRVPLTLDVQLDEQASRYVLERGAPLNLVIDTGLTRVSAAATVLVPADVGDVVPCQIVRTRKVLRAKIVSSREATVVQQ